MIKHKLRNDDTEFEKLNDYSLTNKLFCHKTLEARTAEYDGNLGFDGEYDWGEPRGREIIE